MTTNKIIQPIITLEDYIANPIDGVEWVDGELMKKHPIQWGDKNALEKYAMTARTRRIQSKLNYYWRNYMMSSGQEGEVYVEASCRTIERVRVPDISYITPELLDQYGEFSVLRVSFILVAEVVSPTDIADNLFAKAKVLLLILVPHILGICCNVKFVIS
ncbi:MAG: Uma2 family endonuclease [Cyanobacteria bacterium P01_H01_bin.35]